MSHALVEPLNASDDVRTPVAVFLDFVCKTYVIAEADALRALMVAGGSSLFGLGTDFAVLGATAALLVVIGARVYPRVVT